MSDYRHVIARCQYILMSAAQEMRSEGNLLRLTQGVGLNGDAVFTTHKKRILTGFDQLLREMNFNPSHDGLNDLLKRIEALGGEGIFATITEKGEGGFSRSALRGQLGLAVALAWYQSTIARMSH
ncbi:hypothetical protein CTI14_01820 [Methylobacterium radiotolerans]|nr:hypothetical protein CTI14_01820 [Methylobacterium radiotolerans]